jgi:hypothetical protein
MPVDTAPWWRRHRVLTIMITVVSMSALGVGGYAVVEWLNAPALACGSGMVADAESRACVGVNLTDEPISIDQPHRLSDLIADVKANNDAVATDNYVSIVLLLNLSPIKNVDTSTYDGVYQTIEGAVAATWLANHTATFSGSVEKGEEPKVKLFLANMGSENAGWKTAADQIAANAAANHIVSVVGLGQSTHNTRKVVKELTVTHHIPVIGATVTGDSMNYDIADGKTLLTGFFRVAPTNSDTVAAAAHYITEGLRVPLARVAIVEDMVASDDYIATLADAARRHLGTEHLFTFTSPAIDTDTKAREESLRGQFGYLNINLCGADPQVVYFAGRGTDLGTFVRSWLESNTACSSRPLLVLTGDDGIEAVRNQDVASAVGNAHATVTVQYTGLASPDKWGPCATTPDATTERSAYDRLEAAFTGKPSCGLYITPTDHAERLSYPREDLDNGQAILTHDAVGLAVTTARRTGTSALTDPMSQIGVLQQVRCRSVFSGASGTIQFSADRKYYGNPIGAVLPIQNITKDKRAVTIPPGWSTGGPPPSQGC